MLEREEVAILFLSLVAATCLTVFMLKKDWPDGPTVQFLMPAASAMNFDK